MTVMERVARNVRKRRDARRWSQQALADKLGVQRAYVTQIESGARGVSLAVLEKLAKTFQCSMGDLLGERRRKR
jgi:transcriptional regulator with XRE-family HTH domain